MKTKVLFLLFIILGVNCSLFAQDTVTITIKSITDTSLNKITNKLQIIDSVKGIRDWKLIIDNQCGSKLLLKIDGRIIRNETILLEKRSKKTFEIKNNYFIISDLKLMDLDFQLPYKIFGQDNNQVKKGNIVLKKKNGTDTKNSKPPYKIGIIYYDAVYLASPDSNLDVKIKILQYYGYSTNNKLSASLRGIADSLLSLKTNADNLLRLNLTPSAQNATSPSTPSTGLSSLINSVGNFDVTNIADGIARFLVTRVKEELSIAFFEHFKDILDTTPTSDLKYLFPTTYDILHSIDTEIYNWDNYITTLRDAFDKDISNLVPNLETFEANASVLDEFRKNTACHVSARFALYVAKGFVDHVNAGQLLDDFDADEYIQPADNDTSNLKIYWATYNLRNAVKTLQLISSSLRSRDKDEYWITDSEFRELLYNDNLSGYYNLLLCLKARKDNILFEKNLNNTHRVINNPVHLDNLIGDWNKLKPVINGFIVKVKDFRSSYVKMKTAIDNAKSDSAKAKISYIDLYPFIQSSVNILKYTVETMRKLKLDVEITGLKPILNTTENVLSLLNKGGELGMDLSLKRYSAVIADLTYLIDGTYNLIITSKGSDPTPKVDAAKLKTFTENLIKYGTFMASVANAKNSEEVEKVIQNHALPTGSSRIKRESAFNVSVNAYPGLYGGFERISGVDPVWIKNKHKINSYGITAPIGIAISWGKRSCLKANWSYSFFISVIDIGAITSFRFKNDTIASIPTILLKDIISPGIFFSIGIPKCPLSINMGAQIGPNLRSVSEPSQKNPDLQNNYSNNMYWRYSISLCVDIPILNLANKLDRTNKKKKK